MKKFLSLNIFLSLSLLIVTACSPYPQTPAEEYLQSVHDRATIALSYEKLCEEGKIIPEAQKQNLSQNVEQIIRIWHGEIKKSNLTWTDEKIANLIKARGIVVGGRMDKVLSDKDGCLSEAGHDAFDLLTTLRDTPPDVFMKSVIEEKEKLSL